MALADANPSNGCMTVLRGAHRTADGAPNPLRHYHKRDWMISDEDVLRFPPRGARPPLDSQLGTAHFPSTPAAVQHPQSERGETGGAGADNAAAGSADVRQLPVRAGSCIFFDGLLPHGTAPNLSAHGRRALQFHFCRPDAKACTNARRIEIFDAYARGDS